MKSLFMVSFVPRSADFGLLVLRVCIGISLFLAGWPKLTNFSGMSGQFMSFLGLPPSVSLALLIFAEVVCSVLVAIGLAARFGALVAAFAMGVAFFMAHGGKLQGDNNGMMPFLLLAGFATVFFAGPGRFSFDRKLGGA